jgi:hypothetical protein
LFADGFALPSAKPPVCRWLIRWPSADPVTVGEQAVSGSVWPFHGNKVTFFLQTTGQSYTVGGLLSPHDAYLLHFVNSM